MATQSTLDRGGADTTTTQEFPTLRDRSVSATVECGAATHRGKVRENNEDQYLVARLTKAMSVRKSSLGDGGTRQLSEEVGTLLAVADGMGGEAGGEHASALALETVEDFVLNTLEWFLEAGGTEERALLTELREALVRADRAVLGCARENPRLHGMGTTLTLGYSVGADLFIVHAGDTRAYLLHGGRLDQITSDHTLVQLLVDNGAISPDEARHHQRRNVVTNVIGGPSEGVDVEVHKVRVRDGDVLLLCSDGLTEPVDDAAIAAVLGAERDPERACQRLIGLALDRGGPDNVTAVVARYHVS
jgi:protein phosphatase